MYSLEVCVELLTDIVTMEQVSAEVANTPVSEFFADVPQLERLNRLGYQPEKTSIRIDTVVEMALLVYHYTDITDSDMTWLLTFGDSDIRRI